MLISARFSTTPTNSRSLRKLRHRAHNHFQRRKYLSSLTLQNVLRRLADKPDRIVCRNSRAALGWHVICPQADGLRPSLRGRDQEAANAGEEAEEHGFRQLAGEGILLAGMIGSEEARPSWGHFIFGAM